MEKEIEIFIPETLEDVNLATYMIYTKVVKNESIDPMERVIQLIAGINNLSVDDVRKLPMTTIDEIGVKLLTTLMDDDTKYDLSKYRIIRVNGKEYGLEPNFDKIETGAYIDITQDILPRLDDKLHELMAVLYRPIKKIYGIDEYELESYSDEPKESVQERADLFLKYMPYSTVRAVVNFMWRVIQN